MGAPGLCIVIVNYRTARLATRCLDSLAAERARLPGMRVIVVDNASGDGSAQALERKIRDSAWTEWTTVLALAENGGFATGNNAGLIEARRRGWTFDRVLLLNPDTVVYPGALRALADFMERTPRAGIAGASLENLEGSRERSAHNAPTPLGELEAGARLGLLTRLLARRAVSPPVRASAHECDWVSGACMLIRREVLERVGLLDEGFFLYFEEVDFCTRTRQAGWSVWFVPQARVIHLEGAATGIRAHENRRPAYWFASRRRYFVKHFGVRGLVAADVLWSAGRASLALRRLLRLGRGGATQDPRAFAWDLLWGDARAVLSGQVAVTDKSRALA
jgi:GT2 family glycosyltransferase